MKILIDTHTHSVHSGHAYSTVNENMLYASEHGMEAVAITDHAFALPGGAHPFYFFNIFVIPNKLHNVKLYRGAELNILGENGEIDDFAETDNTALLDKLEFKIASLHPPCISPKTSTDFTKHIINSMKCNNIDVLGHLGDPRYPFNADEVVKYAKESNTLIELNNSSLNPSNPRFDKGLMLNLIETCYKHNALMTFGSDAHFYSDVGNFSNIHALFKEYKIPYDNVITKSLDDLEVFLKANR